jgi:hypothetical protein
MVKPAKRRQQHYLLCAPESPELGGGPSSSSGAASTAPGSSQPPSVLDMLTSGPASAAGVGEVWRGEPAGDWARCAALMRRFGRDGRKLELWRTWLSAHIPAGAGAGASLAPPSSAEGPAESTEGVRPRKQWTEDSGMMPSERDYAENAEATAERTLEVDKRAMAAVLREHVS